MRVYVQFSRRRMGYTVRMSHPLLVSWSGTVSPPPTGMFFCLRELDKDWELKGRGSSGLDWFGERWWCGGNRGRHFDLRIKGVGQMRC